MATIDWAMTELAGFRMGPFALMDFIGHDVNYRVTESVFTAFFYDPRFKPSFTQRTFDDLRRGVVADELVEGRCDGWRSLGQRAHVSSVCCDSDYDAIGQQ